MRHRRRICRLHIAFRILYRRTLVRLMRIIIRNDNIHCDTSKSLLFTSVTIRRSYENRHLDGSSYTDTDERKAIVYAS